MSNGTIHRTQPLAVFATPFILILCLPFFIHALALGGWLNADPIYAFARLTTEWSPGLAPGMAGWNDPNAGWQTEALGRLAARLWLSGEIPWWNYYSGPGMPLAGEMQSSSLFLPFILLLAFDHGIVLLKIAMQIIAGLATYALLRQLTLGRLAATTGALLFEFNGCIAWTAHAPLLPVPFLPLLLLGIEYARAVSLQKPSPSLITAGWATIAIAIALSLYAGFPETAYLNGLLALAWAGLRLFVHPADARLGFVWRVVAGGTAGLLLASPLLWAFTANIFQSDLGPRSHVSINAVGQYASGFALYLFPYLFGPIAAFSPNDPNGALDWIWSRAGGYLGLTIFVVAISGLFSGIRERPLRWLLAIWTVIALAETGAVPGITKIFQLIPLMDYVMFSRFAISSWLFALIVLTSFAIDDRYRGDNLGSGKALAVVVACAIIAALALALAWPILKPLWLNAVQFKRYPALTLLWGITAFAFAAYLLFKRTRKSATYLAALVLAEALVFFAVPLLSSARRPKLDLSAVQFLQGNLGLHRFFTLGPFAPNYGGYFGIASLNADYQPNPVIWSQYVRQHLDKNVDPIMFMGDFPLGFSVHAAEFQKNIANYEKLGVKYLIAPTNRDPFVTIREAPLQAGTAQAFALQAGRSIQGNLPSSMIVDGEIDAFAIEIGTYQGASTGSLSVELCGTQTCARGAASLETAADNKLLTISLQPPLPVTANEALRYSISHPAGADVAVWLRRSADPASQLVPSEGIDPGLSPKWLMSYRPAELPPPQVYADLILRIFELPHPAPYFEAPGCELAATGRADLRAICQGPSLLLRRELNFPQWRATVNGRSVPLGSAEPFFQTIELPAGESRVHFAYSPPYIGWTYAIFWLTALALLTALIPRRYFRRA